MPAASFKCVLLAPCSRCLSAPPRAPTIFLASRSFAILSLAVAIISLTTISFVPYAQQIDFYFTATAAATRCTFTVPGLSPFEPDTPAPITPFILTLILTTSARFSTHPAALLLSGYTSRSSSAGAGWSWLPRFSRGKATGGEMERARSGRDGRSPA